MKSNNEMEIEEFIHIKKERKKNIPDPLLKKMSLILRVFSLRKMF